VVDAACGIGYGAYILAEAGAASVVGIDLSSDAVEYAKRHFSHPRASFVTGNAEQLSSLDRVFQAVTSFETIEHLENPRVFLEEVHAVLEPNGLFVCSTPNKEFCRRTTNPFHHSEMTYEEFAGLFLRYFTIEEQYHQSHSPAYLRHLELIGEIRRVQKSVRFSKLLRLENSLRRLARREQWIADPISSKLERAVPGDYVIEPLHRPVSTHLTFILVGRPRG